MVKVHVSGNENEYVRRDMKLIRPALLVPLALVALTLLSSGRWMWSAPADTTAAQEIEFAATDALPAVH